MGNHVAFHFTRGAEAPAMRQFKGHKRCECTIYIHPFLRELGLKLNGMQLRVHD